MRIELTLSELYVLGRLMGAKYLDMDYFPDDDTFTNYGLAETRAKESLAKKEIIRETFLTIKVAEACSKLLEPIFFGNQVTSMFVGDCITLNESFFKFHFFNGRTVKAELEDGVLKLEEVIHEEVLKDVSLLMGNYCNNQSMFDENNIDTITNAIIVKKTVMHGRKDSVHIFVQNGNLFMAINDGELVNTSSSDAVSVVEELLKEVGYGI